MAEILFDQSSFSLGELDPRVHARTNWEGYYKGAKRIRNAQVIPQGGVQRRWGTVEAASLTIAASHTDANLSELVLDNAAIYIMVWEALSLKIYLENQLMATVVTTYQKEDIKSLDFTTVDTRLIITNQNIKPRQLKRTANTGNVITGVNTGLNAITLTTAINTGIVYPIKFTTAGTLPVTNPQIYIDRVYYARAVSATIPTPATSTTIRIYDNPEDCINDVNYFTVSSTGTGTAFIQNTWTLEDITFKNMPTYDFNGGYSAITPSPFTFTPTNLSGTLAVPVKVDLSSVLDGAVLDNSYVGGVFTGNGGIVRITKINSTTQFEGYTIDSFISVNAIPGTLAFLGEPAWSATRGWPRTATTFQNRLCLAGSPSIAGAVWLSVTNDVYDFDDSQTLDDDAISWYGSIGFIRFMTSTRSLLVHTSNGNYSTPLTLDAPVTPKNFNLIKQNGDGVGPLKPVSIDNQVIFVDNSGTNVKNMIWEITQSSYTLNNISIASTGLIRFPIDMAVFAEANFTDGSYVLLVNNDGTLAILQTLDEQDICAWSLADFNNTGHVGYFRQVVNALNRVWLLVEMWTGSPATKSLHLMELDFDIYTDASKKYTGVNSATLTGLDYLEGETVQVVADGYVVEEQTVVSGQITLPSVAQNAVVGLQYTSTLVPLPVNNILANGNNLYKPKHIRALYVHYYQTIGATIQGMQIPVTNIGNVIYDAAPTPQNGVFQYNIMEGWDGFSFDIEIQQSQPLPMTILGLSYTMEAQ